MKLWEKYFFYDCPGPVVICADFAAGLTAAIARKATEDAEEAYRAKSVNGKGKEVAVDEDPLLSAPPYDVDSQTIIVDWVSETEVYVRGHDRRQIILQRCEWHAVEAIKKQLIHRGYKKERRDKIINLIWRWIMAADLAKLEHARDELLAELGEKERAYLIDFY